MGPEQPSTNANSDRLLAQSQVLARQSWRPLSWLGSGRGFRMSAGSAVAPRGPAPLTIFATPKKFDGHIGLIQRNAIASWIRMNPAPEVILFGTDPGTAEVAGEFGLRHVPSVKCN